MQSLMLLFTNGQYLTDHPYDIDMARTGRYTIRLVARVCGCKPYDKYHGATLTATLLVLHHGLLLI